MMMVGVESFAASRPVTATARPKAAAPALRIVLDFSYDFGIDRRVITIDGDRFRAERDPGSRFARVSEGQLCEDDHWELRAILRDRGRRHRMVEWRAGDAYPRNGGARHVNTWTGAEWTDFMYRLRATYGTERLQLGWGGRRIDPGAPADIDPAGPAVTAPVLVPEAVYDLMAILSRCIGPL